MIFNSATLQLPLLADQKAEVPGKEYPIMKIHMSNLPSGLSLDGQITDGTVLRVNEARTRL